MSGPGGVPVGVPGVLGLSHVFGEGGPLDEQIAFWKGHDYALDFQWDLPVSDEKNHRLLSAPASAVRLCYLRSNRQTPAPGIELLKHSATVAQRGAPSSLSPLLTLFLRGDAGDVRDQQGNRVVTAPQLTAATTVSVRTATISRTQAFLKTLGFLPSALTDEERALFVAGSGAGASLVLVHPLFAQLAVRIVLAEDTTVDERPTVDRPGFSGLSLLVSKLDVVRQRLPLCGHQVIEAPDWTREVAFHNDAGLLVEFLAVKSKRKTTA